MCQIDRRDGLRHSQRIRRGIGCGGRSIATGRRGPHAGLPCMRSSELRTLRPPARCSNGAAAVVARLHGRRERDREGAAARASSEAPSDLVRQSSCATRVKSMGYVDGEKIYDTADLASGNDIIFSATGVTDGDLLRGVRFFGGGIRTSSLFMSLKTNSIRFVDTIFREEGSRLAVSFS